jgi:hypothetical protein
MTIKNWSTTAASNASIADNASINWAEGQAPSTVNDSARATMADVRTWYEAAEWIDLGHAPTYASGTTFTVTGDKTATYTAGRRVKITNSVPTTFYATIASSSFSTNTTVTVVNDGSVLSGTLSSVAVGIINPTNSSEIRTHTGTHTFTSPTLTTPVLGTPSSGTLTNCTGLPNAGLVNSSVTIGGTAIALGGSSSTITNDLSISGLTVGKGSGAVASATAFGYQALNATNTGIDNSAFGYQSLFANTSGTDNSAFGWGSVALTTTGTNNSGIGAGSLFNNTTGSFNTGIGSRSLYSNTTASNNTAVGYQAGYSGTTANTNSFFGYQSGYSATTGSVNTFIGYNSGVAVTTGAKNTILGAYSGNQGGLDIRTASNNIVLSDGDGNPRGWFGPGGNFTVTRSDYSGIQCVGCYNDTTGSAANVFITSGGSLTRSTSSLKYKTDVQNANFGLSDVLKLRPVTYKTKSVNDNGQTFGGLIAEEVDAAGLKEFVQYAEDGSPDALNYGNMVALAFKAIQELKTLVDTQAAEIAELKAKVA